MYLQRVQLSTRSLFDDKNRYESFIKSKPWNYKNSSDRLANLIFQANPSELSW